MGNISATNGGPAALLGAVCLAIAAALAGCAQTAPQITFQSMALQRLGLDTTEYMATY